VFHACDIGNPCLKFEEFINWASLLTYEFNNQTKLEAINNVEVSEMLRYKGKKKFFEGQVGFKSNSSLM
jgi:cAMP-specific phosphodiesterase 4